VEEEEKGVFQATQLNHSIHLCGFLFLLWKVVFLRVCLLQNVNMAALGTLSLSLQFDSNTYWMDSWSQESKAFYWSR